MLYDTSLFFNKMSLTFHFIGICVILSCMYYRHFEDIHIILDCQVDNLLLLFCSSGSRFDSHPMYYNNIGTYIYLTIYLLKNNIATSVDRYLKQRRCFLRYRRPRVYVKNNYLFFATVLDPIIDKVSIILVLRGRRVLKIKTKQIRRV